MTEPQDLIGRNIEFASGTFDARLTINTRGNMMIVGCVDPRVDPTYVLGLEQGETAVIRNVGGRITPSTFHTLSLLAKVGQANRVPGPPTDWNLVVLHHTDCGMTDLAAFPELLADYFEIPVEQLAAKSVSDPRGSVRVDVELLAQTLRGDRFFVTGLVYDVATGLVETVVPATPLRRGPA